MNKDVEKIRAEVKRRREIHRKAKRIESAFEDNAILCYIDSMQEEPVKIKKGCKYRCLSDMVNRDTGNISFIGDKIYLAPKDNTLVSEENGWLCDTSEDASNFELVEEHKKCMYSKDDYTDEDRKVLCDGCEEECKYSHSVNVPFDSKDYELIEATYYIPKGMCAIIEDDKVIIKKK